MPAAVTSASVWWSVGTWSSRAGFDAERGERRVELGGGADLLARQAGVADVDAGVDFDHRAAGRRERVHRPDRDPAVEVVEQPHARKARLGDLRRADRVIGAGGLAPAHAR